MTTENRALQEAVQPDGSLLGWSLAWQLGQRTARLDGSFTAEELEAIAAHMRTHTTPTEG